MKFFEDRGHAIVESDRIVPANDPSLLFTNAGMNQFKDVFLGSGSRPYQRAADTQKCLRVSGKHNDLEEVGHDTYHHTFFEMLGNWSFGDYFKKEAISWAWELLVTQWGLSPDRLYATVHAGDEGLGLDLDEEAQSLWATETQIPKNNILAFGSDDNFWMMGDTGPCGPCSEIHIDLRTDAERERVPGKELVNTGDPRVIEIWNLVFIQYDAQADGSLKPLAAKHVDTGMGLERVVAVIQGKTSNYDTDLFLPLLNEAARLSPNVDIDHYDGLAALSPESRDRVRIALRVVADHVRTCVIAVHDGVIPGNNGRNYVIRRILRRAVRYAYQHLEVRTPFLTHLVSAVVSTLEDAFPDLARQTDTIANVIAAEEKSFLATLGNGIQLFEQVAPYFSGEEGSMSAGAREILLRALGSEDGVASVDGFVAKRTLPGEVAFLLHDTYGFPVDLTSLMARERGISLDQVGYDRAMEAQRDRAKASSAFSDMQGDRSNWIRPVGYTDSLLASTFIGYDTLHAAQCSVIAYRESGIEGCTDLVIDPNPFYAESGGQVGDTGHLIMNDGTRRQVVDTRKDADAHWVTVEGIGTVEGVVAAYVDDGRRREIMRHHSATHLLHAALRVHLGEHVSQQGSKVGPDGLRFDFSHFEKVSPEQLAAITAEIQQKVFDAIPVTQEDGVPIEQAKARGAMALFGEKYGEEVRVVTMDPAYSIELCGGTHVSNTAEIGPIVMRSEGAVASGIRRIELLVGQAALTHMLSWKQAVDDTTRLFKGNISNLAEHVQSVLLRERELKQKLDLLIKESASIRLHTLIEQRVSLGSCQLISGIIEGIDADTQRTLISDALNVVPDNAVVILVTPDAEQGKVNLAVGASDTIVAQGFHAGKCIKVLAQQVGGGGGGRPNLATAGGKNVASVPTLIAALPSLVNPFLPS